MAQCAAKLQVWPRRRAHGRSCRPVHAALTSTLQTGFSGELLNAWQPWSALVRMLLMGAHLLFRLSRMTMGRIAVAGARQCLQAAATTQVSGPALLQLLLAAACCGALLSRLAGTPHSRREARAGASDAANHPAPATAEVAGTAEAAQKADSLSSGTITGTSSFPTSRDVQTLGDLWLPEQHPYAGAHALPAPTAAMSAQAQQIWRLAWRPLDRPASRAAGATGAAPNSQPALGRRLHESVGLQTATTASSSASGSSRMRTSPSAASERCSLQMVSS